MENLSNFSESGIISCPLPGDHAISYHDMQQVGHKWEKTLLDAGYDSTMLKFHTRRRSAEVLAVPGLLGKAEEGSCILTSSARTHGSVHPKRPARRQSISHLWALHAHRRSSAQRDIPPRQSCDDLWRHARASMALSYEIFGREELGILQDLINFSAPRSVPR